MKPKRKQLLVDPAVQGRMLCRVVVYWCAGMVVLTGLAILQMLIESPYATFTVLVSRALLAFAPALIASFVLLPVILFDVLRFSNKFSGPMHRLRREVKRLADGRSYDRINFRKGDFWYELAQQFNRIAERLEKLECSPTTESGKTAGISPALVASK